VPASKRIAAIALCVVLLHAGFIYALYSASLAPRVELVAPIVMVSRTIEPPQPKVVPPAPAPAPAPARPQPTPPSPKVKKSATQTPAAAAPLAVAVNDAATAANVTVEAVTSQPGSAAIAPGASAQATAPATAQLPSSDADYLQNPKPAYPAISRRLNEQGRTTVRVLIGTDGQPQRAEIGKSSGFNRLDDAAVATVMRWRYVPGKRGGVAEAMWFNVPINWVLE